MTILTVQNLSLRLGTDRVLQNISFSVMNGETLVIIGASGSGKSSLLRCINRLEEPESGQIMLHNEDIRRLPAPQLRRRVGMIFQKTAVFPGTVADNLAYGPTLRGEVLSRAEMCALLQTVALDEGLLDRAATDLSGGQEQRLSIARALANRPEILLLDEPTSALDPIATRHVEEALQRAQAQRSLTLLWVSHVIEQARRVADRVLMLEDGRLVRIDSVAAMLDVQTGDQRALAFAAGKARVD